MHTQNARNPLKKQENASLQHPRAGARGRPGPGPGSQAQTGGAVGLRFIVFLRCSFVFGMHMPLSGWKLILSWIQPNTTN